MKLNHILAPWKGDKRYTTIATRASQLLKSGVRGEALTNMLTVEFGHPAERVGMREHPQPYNVFGIIGQDIEQHAVDQIELALRLPVAVQGALMPDAHPGYALPIGGVALLHNAVAPAMVGVDIGCRMHLTIFAEPPAELLKRRSELFADMQRATVFGAGRSRERRADHDVLDDPRWHITRQLKDLRNGKAASQVGTSGAGNHFAELVVGELLTTEALRRQRFQAPLPSSNQAEANIPAQFCGLLTHSGSRGVGFAIAQNYIKMAALETGRAATVPKMYEWLDLEGEAGQEYWQAMELAGDFAAACHEIIHADFLRRTKFTEHIVVQHPHNMAWQTPAGILHRKGATPAALGEWGVIPGSMGTSSYVVEGLGNPDSLESASHGAGRRSSRTAARASISMKAARDFLAASDVLVEGLSTDEAPQAYKDIERVMAVQVAAGLVRPIARMRPVAVIMAGEAGED
jgi:tRNA-splicing ligase RtcB (3'-phosphate/5'-hydroxy nucleic acid ligase)